MSLYKNKYRVESTRLQNWNYGWNAKYFVTIVTKNRKHFFGEIENKKMILSEIGEIVCNEWLKTSDIRPDMNIKLDVFCIMPNHFHSIIEIGKNKYNKRDLKCDLNRRDAMHCVSTTNNTTNNTTNEPTKSKNKFGPQSKNLASIKRGIKSAVTIKARKINPNFGWQSRYYDHIIRNDGEYQRIKNYIINNPKNWKDDIFNTENK